MCIIKGTLQSVFLSIAIQVHDCCHSSLLHICCLFQFGSLCFSLCLYIISYCSYCFWCFGCYSCLGTGLFLYMSDLLPLFSFLSCVWCSLANPDPCATKSLKQYQTNHVTLGIYINNVCIFFVTKTSRIGDIKNSKTLVCS